MYLFCLIHNRKKFEYKVEILGSSTSGTLDLRLELWGSGCLLGA
jgi:hypothetical protein